MPAYVHPYRAVVAVTATHELLSPCGHEMPRFDLTSAFEQVKADQGRALYPRARRCPECVKLVNPRHLEKIEGDAQLACDWAEFAPHLRDAYAPTLAELLRQAGLNLQPEKWVSLSPRERGLVARLGEASAARLGLTFREWASLNEHAPPPVTKRGHARLKASAEEKAGRQESERERLRLKEI